MSNITEPLKRLLNSIEPGWHVHLFIVPLRIIRICRSSDWRRWRVEQLILHNRDRDNPRGAWKTVQVFVSENPGICEPAFDCAEKLKVDLTAKLTKQAEEIRKKAIVRAS